MASWQTIVYVCTNSECLHEAEDLIDTSTQDRDALVDCPICEGKMRRKITANITRASYPDGTKKVTTAVLKERRVLDKDLRKLKIKQRRFGIDPKTEAEIIRIKKEKRKIRR